MNHQKPNEKKAGFLHRRYAIRLGRRYAISAASVVLLGMSVAGYSKPDSTNVIDRLQLSQQELPGH